MSDYVLLIVALSHLKYTLFILGIESAVIIQLSIFGADNRAILEALEDWELNENEQYAILARIPQCFTVSVVPWRVNPKRHD